MTKPQDPQVFFSAHHAAYVVSERHARGRDLDRLVAGLDPKPGERAVDVATGSGHTALRLAAAGVDVAVVDVTPAMLDDALTLARERGLHLTAYQAPAEQLPLADASLDIVTCRRAAHHFADAAQFIREARRTLKEGGRLGISDMTGSLAHIDWLNRLEQFRDPSHHRALAPDEWYKLLVDAGFRDITVELHEEPMTLESWLAPVSPESPDGERALRYAGLPEAPVEFVRAGQFIKRRILLLARV